jgi:hypothetical protein
MKEVKVMSYEDPQSVSNPWVSRMPPHHHAVQFYRTDASLIYTVSAFLREGLRLCETVVVVATPGHQAELQNALFSTFDLPAYGRYLCFDASESLSQLTIKGWPDEDLFKEVIGNMLDSITTHEPLRVYGEMVALLWAGGKYAAAIRLEQLWNRIGAQIPLSLLCGYPIASFQGADDPHVRLLCDLHSHTLCDERLAA